jgi:hypothetical protein
MPHRNTELHGAVSNNPVDGRRSATAIVETLCVFGSEIEARNANGCRDDAHFFRISWCLFEFDLISSSSSSSSLLLLCVRQVTHR